MKFSAQLKQDVERLTPSFQDVKTPGSFFFARKGSGRIWMILKPEQEGMVSMFGFPFTYRLGQCHHLGTLFRRIDNDTFLSELASYDFQTLTASLEAHKTLVQQHDAEQFFDPPNKNLLMMRDEKGLRLSTAKEHFYLTGELALQPFFSDGGVKLSDPFEHLRLVET